MRNLLKRFTDVIQFATDRPLQALAPLGVFACTGLMWAIHENPTLYYGLMGVQTTLILLQFYGLIRMVKATKIRHLKEDKDRLQQFFESGTPFGGAVRFLSIYKDSWPRALYYRLRGIKRLSLYRWGVADAVGSHTKFLVNTKDLFHLQLKGCIDTEDPDKAVEGINFVAKQYLTK